MSDHRQLGQDLDLFYFDEIAPASPFFMPKGAFIYNKLIDFIRSIYSRMKYQEVITPQIFNTKLWEISGHLDHYKENMFFAKGGVGSHTYGIKPMNCPGHMVMFKHRIWSYKDLPLRYADFGRLHRFELSGSTSGLTRVRSFCQDDSHIFLSVNQILEEIKVLLKLFLACYEFFTFDKVKLYLSTRPKNSIGDTKTWETAENGLKVALSDYTYELKEGDGAFYGPKIDLEVADAQGRQWQLGTIQLDFLLPERFDLNFTNQEGNKERPIVIHRAILGSIERFIAILLEHTKGNLPFWLSPEQISIIPLNNDPNIVSYSKDIAFLFEKQDFRISLDDRDESIGYRVRDWQLKKIPFMVVVGAKEFQTKILPLRNRNSKTLEFLSVVEMLSKLKDHNENLRFHTPSF